MAKPRKHAALIKQWADDPSLKIQVADDDVEGQWNDDEWPRWHNCCEYRIKPEPKPDVVVERLCRMVECKQGGYFTTNTSIDPNVRFVFDGETRKLKKVEML